jgi:hypothetical protein
VDLDGAALEVVWQLQRVSGQFLHRETKAEASDATLPLHGDLRHGAARQGKAAADQ